MANTDSPRQQLIESIISRHTEKFSDAAIVQWELMTTKIIAIVGEGGFNSLYARSVFLTQSTFPWLASCIVTQQSQEQQQQFAALKAAFEAQEPAQARAANSALLTTFTDILASLIGDQLTENILYSAWGDSASTKAAKELKK
ncbi:hypothetical protein ACIPF8_04760 [Collimonas sp. NPDC087041]|uniref:hypothetical protein n=1 Tax=Collimonas sp. NPDC087041 TaxID=3363960 RepID=UPI0037F96B94